MTGEGRCLCFIDGILRGRSETSQSSLQNHVLVAECGQFGTVKSCRVSA